MHNLGLFLQLIVKHLMARFFNLLLILAPALTSCDANVQTVEVTVDGETQIIGDAELLEEGIQAEPARMSQVMFSNRREETIEMYWINFNKTPEFLFEIERGQSRAINTWEGHRFIFTPKGRSNGMNAMKAMVPIA